ncbi:MAG: VanW family protein [Saccharofermentans sp.]|nr:VanW family protein [Saccharofermentans sp.]
MKKTNGNSKNTGRVPAVRPGTTVSSARINSSDVAEFDYSALGGGKKAKSGNKSAAPKKAASSSAKKPASKSKSKKNSADKGKKIAAIAAAIVCVLVVVGGALYLMGYAKPVIDFFKPKIEVTLADGTVEVMTVDDAKAELATDTFYQGIIIDGVDVGGMTKDQATQAVAAVQPEAPVSLDISLALEGKSYPLDLSSLPLESNMTQVIDEAFNYGKIGPDASDEAVKINYNMYQQLKVQPVEYTTAYTVNTDGLYSIVSGVVDPLNQSVSDAYISSFDVESKGFDIIPDQEGIAVDAQATSDAVKALIDSRTYSGTVDIIATITDPSLTVAQINENFGLVSSFSTETTNNSNRNSNIALACEKINGTKLEPGEEFSFNGVVGQRTTANGFKEATVIQGGQYEQGLGGGICQVSSTLYNAVVMANLEVTERNAHAWPSSYVPEGLDATVDYGVLDFKFKNNTDYQIFVLAWWDPADSTCHCEIYGKKLPDGQYIKFISEVSKGATPTTVEYVANAEMAVGTTNTVRSAHNSVTAKAYQVWYDKDGNEIQSIEYNTTYYKSYNKKVEVGVLNPDGTIAQLDCTTGAIIGPPPEETAPPPAETPPPENTDAPPPTDTEAPTASETASSENTDAPTT